MHSKVRLAASLLFAASVAILPTAAPVAAGEGIHLREGAIDDDENECHSLEVWNGEVLVKVIPSVWQDDQDECSAVSRSVLIDGRLYFDWKALWSYVYEDGDEGDLWASDGTADGTLPVYHLYSADGRYGNFPYDWLRVGSRVAIWECAYGAAFFHAVHGIVAETRRLPVRRPRGYIVSGNRLFTSGWDPTHGRELWVSDGSREGTHLLMDIRPGTRGSRPSETSIYDDCYTGWGKSMAKLNGRLYFAANDGTHGRELWVTNGTAAGTHLVKDIRIGPIGADPSGLRVLDDGLVHFIADDGNGLWPWVTDGTSKGTHKVPRH